VQVVYLEQSGAERDFYKALLERSQTEFNEFVAAGTVMSKWAHVLVLLLRLRQACCHPFLSMARSDTDTSYDALFKHFMSQELQGGTLKSRDGKFDLEVRMKL